MARQKDEFAALSVRIQIVRVHADSLDPGDPVRAELAKYLCILASGVVESKIRSVVRRMVAQTHPHDSVGNAAVAYAEGVSNPRWERLLVVMKKISPHTAERLGDMSQEYAAAVDSIMSNRHRIAHGRDTQISINQIADYIDRCIDVFAEMDKAVSAGHR